MTTTLTKVRYILRPLLSSLTTSYCSPIIIEVESLSFISCMLCVIGEDGSAKVVRELLQSVSGEMLGVDSRGSVLISTALVER
jgi:hypothetical protein